MRNMAIIRNAVEKVVRRGRVAGRRAEHEHGEEREGSGGERAWCQSRAAIGMEL